MERLSRSAMFMQSLDYLVQVDELKDKSKTSKIVFNDDLNEVFEYLNNTDLSSTKVRKSSRKEIIETNKMFFDEFVKIQDIYINKGRYASLETPLNLKIKLKDGEEHGLLSLDYGNFPEIVFDHIELSRSHTSNSIGIYAHELTHSQLERKVNVNLTNYYNREMLSILIEKIIMYELKEKEFHNIELMRLRFIKEALKHYKNNTKNMNIESYIISTFEAMHMFYIYANSSIKQRMNILKEIENIFKYESTVEELLKKHKVNYKNSHTLRYVK